MNSRTPPWTTADPTALNVFIGPLVRPAECDVERRTSFSICTAAATRPGADLDNNAEVRV